MTPDQISVLSAQLAANTKQLIEVERRWDEARKEDRELWYQIHEQVKATNGRVTKLEMANIAQEAIRKERAGVLAAQNERQIRKEDYRKVHLPSILPGWVVAGLAIAALIWG